MLDEHTNRKDRLVSRPESISDLPESVRRGARAIEGHFLEFQNEPTVITAWGQLLEAATAAGYTLEEGTLFRTPTVSELEDRLREHQKAWDSSKTLYDEAIDGASEPRYPWALQEWCRKEGLRYPYEKDEAAA